MKKGWQTKKLGEVCEIIKGRKPTLKAAPSNGDLPYLVAKVMRGSAEAEYASVKDRNSVTVEESETIIICDGSNSGEVFTGFRGILSSTMGKIAKKAEIADDYLRAFLASTFEVFNGAKTGAAIPHLDKEAMYQVQFPFPPLAEQQRIVGVLDEAFAGLATAQANAEKNLQNARALFESHLHSVFTQGSQSAADGRGKGWVEKPFSELCDIKHGYAFEGEFFSNQGEYVLLTPGNFYETGGYRDRGEKQKYYTGEIPCDYVLNEGDLLVAMTEQAAGLLGSPILVPESDKFLHNQRLGLVTKKPGVVWTNEFFFHVFNTQPVRKAIHASASGVKVRHTSPTKIGNVVVAFPTSFSEQKRIVSTLATLTAETQRLAHLYERKQAALVVLKQALLHQAFTGQF
jgi:type I restriction enzyme S subunit